MTLTAKAGCFLLLFFAGILDRWLTPPSTSMIAFVNVTIIPMDRDRTIPGQTVLVKNDRIVQIGDWKKVVVPENVETIKGKNLFLMPGLADMHVHLHSKADALLMVANGITTVRNMRGTSLHLSWRPQIEKGKILAPSIYSCGSILDGNPPTGENVTVLQTAEEIETSIAHQKRLGFDCVKVYNRLSPAVYEQIVSTAHRQNLTVAGHVPFSVGLSGALAMGQDSIEHLTGYMNALRITPGTSGVIDQEKIPELAKKTQKAGVWNCPTLVVQQRLTDAGENFDKLIQQPEIRYVAPSRLSMWNPSRSARFQAMNQEDFESARRGIHVLKELTRTLQKSGARLLLGTDAPSYFVVPGFSAHQELQNLVNAGLSPFQALQAATTNPAEFLKGLSEFGTVETGKRADLLLIKCNPLKNISCAKQLAGVMLRGHWISENRIQEMLKDVIESYKIPENRFENLPELPAESGLLANYEIIFNNTVVGEERISIRNDSDTQEIFSQQVADPPLEAIYQTKIHRSDQDLEVDVQSSRPEGDSNLMIRFSGQIANLQAFLPYRKDLQRAEIRMPGDSLLDGGFIATKILIAERLQQLKVGDVTNFVVKEFDFGIFVNKGIDFMDNKWKVRRDPDTNGNLNFAIEMQWQYQKGTATLILDPNGIPLSFERGPRVFRRKS